MGLLSKSSCVIIFTLVLFFIAFARITATNISSSAYNNLVYKNCIDQTSPSATSPLPSMLSSLLQELVEKSSQYKFYETYTGDDTIAISGVFQCRGDLTNHDCFSCVSKLPEISNTLCGTTIPARVQLSGCYVHYKADEQPAQSSVFRHDLQHKTCGKSIGESSGVLQEVLDGAFAELLSCAVGSSSKGFCDVRYESMHVMAQCAGNSGDCECGACVSNAVQLVKDECRDSVSGEIYLDGCYVNYSFDDHGFPTNFTPEKGNGVSSAKLVAIVVGGVAALCLGLVCCHFLRASRKKHDDW